MAKWTPDIKFIASIYPGELDSVPLNHGPSPQPRTPRRTVYKLTPVPRDKARTNPCVIEVRDGFEDVIDLMGAQTGRKTMPKPVDSAETVACLLKYWTGSMVGVPPGATPGIIEIANTVPTQAEFRQMFEIQTAYFEFLFQTGERLNRENNWKEITGAMRIGAEWLGRDSDWSNPARVTEMVACPACGELIMPKMAVCKHCHTRLRALPKEIAAFNQQDPVITETVA
jgi:hypothetical protein